MAATMNAAAEAFSHVLVARLVVHLRTRAVEGPVTHEELMEVLTGTTLAPVPPQVESKKSSKKSASPPQAPPQVVEAPPQVVEAPPQAVEAPPQAVEAPPQSVTPCKGTVLGKPCIREAVKGKDLCKQCQINHAKKERDTKKKDAVAAPPAAVAASPALLPVSMVGTRALVAYDESKHLYRNLHTNWIVYDTDTESKVIGIAQGDDIVPLTQTEREAALRTGFTVEGDPEATQVDPATAPAPVPVPKEKVVVPAGAEPKKTIRKPRAAVPPPPALPIPTSDFSEASTLPL